MEEAIPLRTKDKDKIEDEIDLEKETVHHDDDSIRHTSFNFYATNKTVVQGLLDLALLTTNATQLKHIVLIGDLHPFYELILYGVILSLILQIVLGVLLLISGHRELDDQRIQRLNNYCALLIFIITITNVIVSIFNDETISRKYRDCKRLMSTVATPAAGKNNYTDI